MVSRNQSTRFWEAKERPSNRPSGELFTNTADMQIGTTDRSGSPVDLIPVRFHSTTASYKAGDLVVYGNAIWAAKVPIDALGWDPSLWVNLVPTPDLSPYYAKTGGPISGAVSISGSLSLTGTFDAFAYTRHRETVQFDKGIQVNGPIVSLDYIVSQSGNFYTRALNPSANAHYWFQNSAAGNIGVVYMTAAGDMNFNFAGNTRNAQLRASDGAWIVPGQLYAQAAYPVWHSGNLNPGLYMPVAGGTFGGSIGVNGSVTTNPWGGVIQSQYGYVYGNTSAAYPNYGTYGRAGPGYGGVLGYSQNGAYYGILGHTDYYALYGSGSVYATGNAQFGGNLNVGGSSAFVANAQFNRYITTTQGGADVLSSTANAHLNTSGTLQRCTSSLATKTDIEPLWDSVGDLIMNLKPIFFRPKARASSINANNNWSYFGFGAEEVAAVDPRFAQWDFRIQRDEAGEPLYDHDEVEEPNPEWAPDPDPEKEDNGKPKTIKVKHPKLRLGPMQPENLELNAIVAALVAKVQSMAREIEELKRGSAGSPG